MRTHQKLLVTGAALIAAVELGNQFSKLNKNFDYKIIGLLFNKQKSEAELYSKLFWLVKLILVNPSAVEVTVSAINLELYYQDTLISKISSDEKIVVKANAKTLVNLKMKTDVTEDLKIIVPAFKEFIKNAAINLTVKGKIVTEVGEVIINNNFKVEL